MKWLYNIFGSTIMTYVILTLGFVWFVLIMLMWINFIFFAPGGEMDMYRIPGL